MTDLKSVYRRRRVYVLVSMSMSEVNRNQRPSSISEVAPLSESFWSSLLVSSDF
jgi:hypothetical protein